MNRKTWATWPISILVTLSVLLLIGLLFFAFRQPLFKTDDSVPCTTLACIDTAYQLLHRMDQNVNPCDDFYQFTCGGFLNSTNDEYDIEKKQPTEMLRELKKVLEQNSSVNEPEYLKLAKKFYAQCSLIDTETKGYQLNLIKPIESWPVLKGIQWNESEFNFNKTIFKVGNTTKWINYFFQFTLDINDYSSIEIWPISYKLTSDQLNQGLNDSDVKNYYDTMIALSTVSYTDTLSNITVENMINDILKFETDILNMTLLPENERSNDTSEDVIMTLDELKNNYNYFDWEEYINYLRGSPVNKTTTKISIKDINYLKNLKYLLNSTEKLIQSNYITWKHYQKKYEILDLLYSYYCVSITIQKLPIAMGAIYYQNHRDNSIKDDILQIIMDIKKQYTDIIINSKWVDDMTKKKAIEKLESLKYFIEYPKEYLNNSIIDKFHGSLKFFDEDNYIDQSIRIDLFNQKFLLTQNNESFWAYWGENMLDYNAYNYRTENILVLPPVYQNVLFKKNNSNSINYGLIGRTIGHEIGHAFDNTGILYDANGIKNNWWRNDSLQNFKDLAMRMVEQYGNYSLPEINENVNGVLTLDENIADNSGLKAAYRGYIKKLESLSNGETLPGLSYNSKQLFWISYANRWCKKVTDESLKRNLLDEHSPNKFRVIGPLSNIQEFSNDFQCPIGSKMNPTKKYTIW